MKVALILAILIGACSLQFINLLRADTQCEGPSCQTQKYVKSQCPPLQTFDYMLKKCVAYIDIGDCNDAQVYDVAAKRCVDLE